MSRVSVYGINSYGANIYHATRHFRQADKRIGSTIQYLNYRFPKGWYWLPLTMDRMREADKECNAEVRWIKSQESTDKSDDS